MEDTIEVLDALPSTCSISSYVLLGSSIDRTVDDTYMPCNDVRKDRTTCLHITRTCFALDMT